MRRAASARNAGPIQSRTLLLSLCVPLLILSSSCSGRQRPIAGCGKDTDCLGGRICSERNRCIEPPEGSAAIPTVIDAGVEPPADAEVQRTGAPPFAMFGGNARHTGQLAGEAPLTRPTLLWEHRFDKPIVGSPTLGPDGTIYVTSHDHHIHALDVEGKLKWSFKTGDRVWSTPAVAEDGTVYTGSDDDHLYALDGESGAEKWRLRIGNCTDPLGFGPEGTRCDVDGGPTIGPDGSIYVGGDGLYAVWPNGVLRWKFATAEHVSTAPAMDDMGNLYIGCLDDAVYAVSPEGTKLWEFRTSRDVESAPAIGEDGTVYVGSDDDAIYALDREGNQLWKVITGDDVRASPSIGPSGDIYVGSYDKRLYALSPGGEVRWRFSAADKIHGAVGVAQNDVLLVGSQDDNLYALSSDGRLLWYLPFDADIDPTPALSSDGRLYVVGDGGVLRAFQ